MKYDLSSCTDEEIEGMVLDLKNTLAHRRQVARKQFIHDNPILGYSLRNDDAWKGFWENINLLSEVESLDSIRDGFRAFPIRNPELKSLLLDIVVDTTHFDPRKNTSSGESHKLAPFI